MNRKKLGYIILAIDAFIVLLTIFAFMTGDKSVDYLHNIAMIGIIFVIGYSVVTNKISTKKGAKK